jgi:hypothetical protein
LWADFLRRRITQKLVENDFEGAIKEALKQPEPMKQITCRDGVVTSPIVPHETVHIIVPDPLDRTPLRLVSVLVFSSVRAFGAGQFYGAHLSQRLARRSSARAQHGCVAE